MRAGWIVGWLTLLLALPGTALAASNPHWEYIGEPAPGGSGLDGTVEADAFTHFTVANGTPYLGVLSRNHGRVLNVYRAVGTQAWRQLDGGQLNTPGTIPGSFDLTSAAGTAWIAWAESTAPGASSEVHVALLTRDGVRELRGSPIAGAAEPQIAYYAGRLYVAYAGADGMHAARTRANGRGFERIESFDDTPAFPQQMGAYGGRLYLSDFESNTTLYSILNRRRTGWVQVDEPPADLFAPRLGGTVFTYGFSGADQPEAPSFVHVFATRSGVTEELPSPEQDPRDDVTRIELAVSAGTLWVSFVEGGRSAMGQPRLPHVARFVRR